MLANAVLKQLNSVELGHVCLWAQIVHHCFSSVSLTYIFSVFPVRKYMLFLTHVLKFTLLYIIVCLFDAIPFSSFAGYYTHRCALQACIWIMPWMTSAAVFRSPFFHEVLRSGCPWTAACVRSEVFCDMVAERLAAVITMPMLILSPLHLADNTNVGVFQDFVSW